MSKPRPREQRSAKLTSVERGEKRKTHTHFIMIASHRRAMKKDLCKNKVFTNKFKQLYNTAIMDEYEISAIIAIHHIIITVRKKKKKHF